MRTVGRRLTGPLLLVVTCLFWMTTYTYPSYLTPYLETLSVSLTMAGVIVGSYGFTQMVLRFPLGMLSSRTGRLKLYVLAGLVIGGVSSLGLALTTSAGWILFFRGLAGVAAAFWVQISSLYLSYYQQGESTQAVSRISFTQNLGTILGTYIGSRAIVWSGMQAAFTLGAGFAVVGLLLGLFLRDIEVDEPSDIPAPVIKWFSATLVWASVLAAVSQMISFGTIQGFVPQLASQMGGDADYIGYLSSLGHVARAAATLVSGQFLLRWFNTRKQLLATALLNAVLVLLIPYIPNLALLLVHQMLSSACAGIQMAFLMDQATKRLPPRSKSTAMGFYQAVYGIGMVLGPALMGRLSDVFSMQVGFTAIGLIALAGFGLMVRFLND